MNSNFVKLNTALLIIFLCFNFSSCSKLRNYFSLSNTENNINDVYNNEETFSLKILEKIDDGDKIYILGEATSNERIPVSIVLLKLRMMSNTGAVLSENSYSFASLMGKDKSEYFERNNPKKFLIIVDSNHYRLVKPTDFQLELSWGQEATNSVNNNYSNDTNNVFTSVQNDNTPSFHSDTNESVNKNNINVSSNLNNSASKNSEALKMKNLSFEKKMTSLKSVTPQYYFTITGEFENLSDNVINDISLAVSFKSKLSDNRLNGDDEFLDIKDIALKPKSSKKFEMELETILNSQDANIYKPVIKIVSFK